MKQQKDNFFYVFIMIVTILLFFVYVSYQAATSSPATYQISVLIPDYTNAIHDRFCAGLEQAAEDNALSVTYVTWENTSLQYYQSKVIRNETSGTNDALIVQPVHSEKIETVLQEVSSKLPIALLDEAPTAIPEDMSNCSYLHIDYRSAGNELARRVKAGNDETVTIGIITGTPHLRTTQQLLAGIQEELDGYTISFIQDTYSSDLEWPQVLICLDETVLLDYAQLKQENDYTFLLYGIGGCNQTLTYLDEKWIEGILAPDDYRTGYLCLTNLVKQLSKEESESDITIPFYWITGENMYEPDMQKRLFPITS